MCCKLRTKVLIASTSEVYGKGNSIPFREDADVVLGPTCRSRWAYAASKMVDEFLALAYHQKKDLPVVIFRLFNTVGPRQTGLSWPKNHPNHPSILRPRVLINLSSRCVCTTMTTGLGEENTLQAKEDVDKHTLDMILKCHMMQRSTSGEGPGPTLLKTTHSISG